MIKNEPTAQISIDWSIFFIKVIIGYKTLSVKQS